MAKLVSAREIINKAKAGKYAVAHININNLEWAKTVLIACEETHSPVILGVSEGAGKYMCGFKVVKAMVESLMDSLNITVPVVLHLDHGSYDGVFKALDAGFSSIMFDGSHLPFEENLKKTKEILEICNKKGVSLEAEVGTIGGEEDGIIGFGDLADPVQCKTIAQLGVTMLAAGIGNVHGAYPENWKGLNFERLQEIEKAVYPMSLVLHGGSGIPDEQIKKAISLGVNKINVNSELQWVFAQATIKYINDGKCVDKGQDPRKLLAPGCEAMKKVVIEKLTLFGSLGKA